MKLYYDKRLKDPTYYVQQGFRNGNKTTTRNVRKIGKHSELLKICDDPLSYAKKQIEILNEEYRSGKSEVQISVDFNEKVDKSDDDLSRSELRNIGYFYLQAIYQKLRISDFFRKLEKQYKTGYDMDQINRFLTYGRILDPRSKYGTYDHLDVYYEQPDIAYQHILRFMDILCEHYDDYIGHLYEHSSDVVKRDTSIIYYDCSNYYFESERYDEDIIDEVTGEVIEGLRQYGISKEHRPNPIVEMGLLMDSRGIPLSMCIEPGNRSEQLTAIPLEQKLLKLSDKSKLIYCADAGLGSYNIRQFNDMGGRAFIVTQSIKKLSDTLKEAIFNDYDYRLLSDDTKVSVEKMKTFDRFDKSNLDLYNDFAYKVIEADHIVDLGLYDYKPLQNGKYRKVKAKGTLRQRIIVTFSRKAMEYQRSVRNRQIERAKKLLNSKDPEQIRKGPNDISRFLKRSAKDKDGKEVNVGYILDEEKIREEEKYDGYYALATNLEDKARDIIAVNSKRYLIEDCFRIMKTNFDARPVYHRLPHRIRAHFLICYTALVIYRLLECLLDDNGTHITTDDLIDTLKNMNVVNVHDLHYMAVYKASRTLTALEAIEPLILDRKYYKPKDLNGKIKNLKK